MLINEEKESEPILDKKLSVLVVGVDSVSRLNLHRLMPRTLSKLKEMGALELYGYHKVGDNSYPNLVPMLSGYTYKEFQNLCIINHNETFEKCPLIWNEFSARGYRTIDAGDTCVVALFNYIKSGFR